MTRQQIEAVIAKVTYKDWRLVVDPEFTKFRVKFRAPCVNDPGPDAEDALIKTIWLAIEVAEKHEMMENFRVDGVAVFNPHTSVDTLRTVNLS